MESSINKKWVNLKDNMEKITSFLLKDVLICKRKELIGMVYQ